MVLAKNFRRLLSHNEAALRQKKRKSLISVNWVITLRRRQLGAEHIRRYQLFLIQEKKLAWSSYNQIVCALRFFYGKTLKREFLLSDIPFPRKVQHLPLILSMEEVARILTAPEHLKSRALLMTIYAAGLRRSEVARLRVHDIDSARMTITVHQGKGRKDRVVMLSPVLLETLRQYWRYEKPKEWLFPGKSPNRTISWRRTRVLSG